MIAGAVQFLVAKADKDGNLAKVERLIDRKVDLVVLPELFSTGYSFDTREEIKALAEPIPSGFTTKRLCEIAAAKQCHLIGAIAESDGNELYITAVVVGPQGYIGKQRKRHLAESESAKYRFGADSCTFDICGVKTGAMVCFDGWFPETARELALKGAKIICHSALTTQQRTLDIVRVRAIENCVFVIFANSLSTEALGGLPVTFRGDSRVIDCEGNILVNAGKDEKLVTAEIDISQTAGGPDGCKDILSEAEKHRHTMFQ